MYIEGASNSDINARTNPYKPITPYNLEYAVKSVVDKPWVLKGTLTTENKASGVNVDLSGCTELLVKSDVTGSTSTKLTVVINNVWNALIDAISANGRKTGYARFSDCQFGIEPITSCFGSDNTNIYQYMSGAFLSSQKVSNISRIVFGNASVITSCTVEIYGR